MKIAKDSPDFNPFLSHDIPKESAEIRFRECTLNNSMVYYYFEEVEASLMFEYFKNISNKST